MIRVKSKGDFRNVTEFIKRQMHGDDYADLEAYAQMGVDALSRATPVDSGLSAASWYYKIDYSTRRPSIEWHNDNIAAGVPVVILLQYGHGTGTGGYVQGRDFINPAMRPIFDQIAENVWKKVIS